MRLPHPVRTSLAVGVIAAVAGLTNLKLGSLQIEDFALLCLFALGSAKFAYSGLVLRLPTFFARIAKSYGLLLFLLAGLALFNVRLTFYPLDDASFLKQPILFSISKLLQLSAVVAGLFWLTSALMGDRKRLLYGINAYWFAGIAVSLYALCSYVLLAAIKIESSPTSLVGAYRVDDNLRARGLFNEGGPFGLYVVSVVIVGILRCHVSGKRFGKINAMILIVVFLASGSKAGFFAVVILAVYWVISAASLRRKATYLALSAVLLIAAASWLDLRTMLLGYVYSYQNIEEAIAIRGNDPSLVLGRIAALYIVPRMIVAHPLTGIGIGNYPLIRNDPQFLGRLPAITDAEDLPALGLPGIAAEMGIPAALWLLVLLFAPYWASRKQSSILRIVALFQPISHLLGVQLTFFYPWFVSACALAASSSYEEVRPPARDQPSFTSAIPELTNDIPQTTPLSEASFS